MKNDWTLKGETVAVNGKNTRYKVGFYGVGFQNKESKFYELAKELAKDPNFEGLKVYKNVNNFQISLFNHHLIGTALSVFVDMESFDTIEDIFGQLKVDYLKRMSKEYVDSSNNLVVNMIYSY